MNQISFYLIHNNSTERIKLRNKLKELSNYLNIDLFEIYKQKKLSSKNLSFRAKLKISKIYFLRVFFDLIHKKDISFDFCFLILKSLLNLNLSIFNLIFIKENRNLKSLKHLEIESLVTRKHIKAWEHFLKSKKEIMVIFEDDTICKKDSKKRLKDLFKILRNIDLDNTFIDLAGGLKQNDVIPKRKLKNFNGEFLIVKGIYTNTACSYLINRNLIKLLYEEYQRSNLNNSFPIDHLINKLGLNLKSTHNIFSIHFKNPLFTHGSFKANIKSWQNY